MENCLSKAFDLSEPLLAEDSTLRKQAISLKTVIQQLDGTATNHDYLVGLLLIFLAESGFAISSDSRNRQQRTRIVCIPSNWKRQESEVYEIDLILYDLDHIWTKLIAIPLGDLLVVNLFANMEDRVIYSMMIRTLRYVNPYTPHLYMRYMNIKEISVMFKDNMVTPLRGDILLISGRTGPSFQCLPEELQEQIAIMRRQLE